MKNMCMWFTITPQAYQGLKVEKVYITKLVQCVVQCIVIINGATIYMS